MLGKIILIGGSEERTKEGEILKQIVHFSQNKKIGIIPTGFKRDPLSVYYKYEDCFKSLGMNVCKFDIRDKNEVDRDENIKNLYEIDTVFFTGGDQERLYNIFEGTKFLKIMKNNLSSKYLNYVGTSAGAAVVGEKTFFGGDYKGFEKGMVSFCDGFSLIKDVLVDTHFSKRARLPRLHQALVVSGFKVGIGINENTAVILDEGKVIGEGCVYKLDASDMYTNYWDIELGDKIEYKNFKLDISFENIKL
jgi:cyanophycinase